MFAILRHTFAIQMQIYIVVGTNLATLNTFSFFKKKKDDATALLLEKLCTMLQKLSKCKAKA